VPQLFVVPPKDVEIQLADSACVAVSHVTLFPKCWVSSVLKMQSVPAGCIALPLWLRSAFAVGDDGFDLVGHRVTISYLPVHQLPVATCVTLRCVAKHPHTLPDFFASTGSAVALCNPMVILREQMQSRQFKALTVGLRFSLFYCSKNNGGSWDFQVCRVKARGNNYDSHDVSGREVMLTEGTAACVFSNCENTGFVACEYIDLPDTSVSVSPAPTHCCFNDMKPGDQFNFHLQWPKLDFASHSASHSVHATALQPLTIFQSCFGLKPDAAAYAPGSLEFLGNHLEYNGGAMHGVSIDKGATAYVAFQKQSSQQPQIRVRMSQTALPIGHGPQEVSVFFDDLLKQCSKDSRTMPAWALNTVRYFVKSVDIHQTIRLRQTNRSACSTSCAVAACARPVAVQCMLMHSSRRLAHSGARHARALHQLPFTQFSGHLLPCSSQSRCLSPSFTTGPATISTALEAKRNRVRSA
jgi:hypothetical protein